MPDQAAIAAARGGPTVLRIMLGAQLRRLREARGITRDEAGYSIRSAPSKISRLELGRSTFKQRDVADLLTLYGMTDAESRESLLELARRSSTPGWWHQYGDLLPNWFEAYVGLEAAAATIASFEVQLISSLLQTEDYARALIKLSHENVSFRDLDRHVQLRKRRQQLLAQKDGPRLWSIMDEAALRRPIGGREVLRGQLTHLIEMADHPRVTIQVLPLKDGGHAAVGGPFTILGFEEPELPAVVYLEQLTSALYIDKQDEVDMYTSVMEKLGAVASPAHETPALLEAILKYV